MPKAIGVNEEDYEFVKGQRRFKPDAPDEKESMIETLHRIISECRKNDKESDKEDDKNGKLNK